jgi:hypothetical protein
MPVVADLKDALTVGEGMNRALPWHDVVENSRQGTTRLGRTSSVAAETTGVELRACVER